MPESVTIQLQSDLPATVAVGFKGIAQGHPGSGNGGRASAVGFSYHCPQYDPSNLHVEGVLFR